MKNRLSRVLILGGVLSGWLMAGERAPLWAADMSLHPSLAVSEEFNDNVFETATGKRSDFITRIQPGGAFTYKSPLWTWDAKYTFEYDKYARLSNNDQYIHNADLRGSISLIDNFLFLDVGDTYRRVPLDVVRNPDTISSLFLNQTDQNVATVSPYALWRLGEKDSLKTGYRFTDTRYWGDGIDRREHGAFASLSHEVTSKFSLSAEYAFSRLESRPSQYNQHNLSGGFRYEYAEKSFLFGQAGNSWLNFNKGDNTSFIFWNAGITHDFTFVVATFETRSQISVDPSSVSTKGTGLQASVDPLAVSTKETSYSGKLVKTLERGMASFGVSYSEYENIQSGNPNKRNRFSLNGVGRHELWQDFFADLHATAERTSRLSSTDIPYRFLGALGLSYSFKNDLVLGVTYTYVTNLQSLFSSAGSITVNKALVEVKKTF